MLIAYDSLLGNAVKFTEEGYILVKSHAEELPRNVNGRVFKIIVTVQDTVCQPFYLANLKGIGISQDKFELLFRAFSQIDNSNKRNYGGTGLGLAICEKLVQLMGGKIWVESEAGKGTKFHFSMVLNIAGDRAEAAPIPNLAQTVPLERRNCLLIEHSEIVRNLLARDIKAVGLHEEAVSNQDDAKSLVALKPFSVAIIDMSIPGSSAFVKELAEKCPDTRVITTSNLGNVADISTTNVVNTLIKPIRRWRLLKTLEKALSSTPMLSPAEEEFLVDRQLGSPKENERQALASLGFRHPLRILVFTSSEVANMLARGR